MRTVVEKRARRTLAALIGIFVLAAPACRPNQTLERQSDDARIKTSIKARLASDVRLSTLTAVSVDVTNGIVTLAGPVHSAEEKQKIEETVRSVRGVVNVTNGLQIEPAGGPAIPASVPPAPAPTLPPGTRPSETLTPLPFSATPPAPVTPSP
jgi:hypothetical protein